MITRLRPVAACLLALALAACTLAPDPRFEPSPLTGTAAPTGSVTASSAPSASPTDAPSSTTPSPGVSSTPAPSFGEAYAAALALQVKGRAPKTGYSRDEFGAGWVDVDRNGCDTRNDMLALRLSGVETAGRCRVLSGTLEDPFTAATIAFERGGASEVDIDHLVPLSDAWQKGAQGWEFAKRVAFANDPLNLEPVAAAANRQKGDSDAATWLPSNTAYRCEYVARQIAVKTKYEAWVTQAELDAMLRVLDTCPAQPLPGPGDQPVIAENTGPLPEASSAPGQSPASSREARYATCADATAAGRGPYVAGIDPEYDWYRDGDRDGVVCEG